MKLLSYISIFLLAISSISFSATKQVVASKDNTMYDDYLLGSNGAGDHFFAGRSGGERPAANRRALLQFDFSSIPVEAKVTSVKLTLHMSRTNETNGSVVTIHRLTKHWGEEDSQGSGGEGGGGSASVGDATWSFAFMRTVAWQTPGGDFMKTASASQSVGDIGYYSWGTTANMVADVQNWVSNPDQNYGWLIKGDESTETTAKRFDSRTNTTVAYRPILEVEYEAPDVYITEVFKYPGKEGIPGEFVEIYNGGRIEQKLDGWWLFQPSQELITSLDEKSLLSGDLILQPGEYAVIGRGSAEEFKNLWGFLPDTYFSQGNSSNSGAPQIVEGTYWRLYNQFQTIVDRYGSSDTFGFSTKFIHYTRVEYPNNGAELKHWLADNNWGNPGTDNLAPVAVNDNQDVNEDNEVSIDVLANDSDLDGSLNKSSVEIMSAPTNGIITGVNGATGAVTYEPDKNYHGADQFKYIVFDDKGKPSNQATVFINVISVNDAPVAKDDEKDTKEDTAVDIDVLANDEDIDGILISKSVEISKAPAHGTADVNSSNGVVTYSPEKNYNGPDQFSYTVEDDSGAVSNAAIVSIVVSAENDPPVIGKLPILDFNEDQMLKLPLASLFDYVEDPDTPDDQLELKLSGGKNVIIDSDGSNATLTSQSNWFGEDTIALEVSDGESSDKADLYVVVHSLNDIPEMSGLPKSIALNADSTESLMLWDFVSDVETSDKNLKYSFTKTSDSLNLDFEAASGKLTITAIFGLNRDVTVEITVKDDSSAVTSESILVQVETISGLADRFSSQPAVFALSQNYPNPFNPSTTIGYQLAEAVDVQLQIYNTLGQMVAVLVSERQSAGEYRVKFDTAAFNLASGVYIYHLRAGNFQQVRKMILLQ